MRSPNRRFGLWLAGAMVSACGFPEYITTPNAAGGGGAGGSSAAGDGVSGIGAGAGTGSSGASASGASGVDGGAGGTGGPGGNGGSSAVGGGGEAASNAGGDGGVGGDTCGQASCPPASCKDGVKNDNEASIDCGDALGACGDCVFSITKYVIGSGSGFSGSAVVTWGTTGIVFDFTVVDDTPHNDSSDPWNDDAVEVYLDLNNAKSMTYQADDLELIVPRDESPTYSPQDPEDGPNTGAMPVERSSNAAGYTVKLTIPWSSVGRGESPPLAETIGFDLAVDNDVDGGGRDAQVVVFGTAGNYLDTSTWGALELN